MTQMDATLPDRTTRAQQLARTYGGDRDGWERVTEYQRVQRWRGKHPERGSGAASTALDLPRGRIRPWFDGSKPDPVHAVETADIHGWLDAQPGDRVFEALSVCHAWIVAGGTVLDRNYVPQFAVGPDDPEPLLIAALRAVGMDATVSRDDEPGRGKELRPATDAPTLGRFLTAVLDAPIGQKTDAEVRVPNWLAAAPFETRLRWARTYVSVRGTEHARETANVTYVQIIEDRPDRYLQSLGAFFAEILGVEDEVLATGHAVRLRPRAAAMLDVVPELPA